MTIFDVFSMIESELPYEIVKEFNECKTISKFDIDYSKKGFSIWKIENLNKVKYVFERRLLISDDRIKPWVQNMVVFFESAIMNEHEIWQANNIEKDVETDFLINVSTKKYITAQLPRR